jgi:hypothetical protein
MTSKNDITGDSLTSRVATEQYRDNYDKIFRSKQRKPDITIEIDSDLNFVKAYINQKHPDNLSVMSVGITPPTTEVTEMIKETEIIIHPNECENIVGEGVVEALSGEAWSQSLKIAANQWATESIKSKVSDNSIFGNRKIKNSGVSGVFSLDQVKEFQNQTHFSDRGIPLVWTGPLLQCPVITVENYCKWYSPYVIMPDGVIRKITSEEICQATDDYSNAWHIDHCFHPKLLLKLAEMLNGEACEQSIEMAAGRWVMEQMDDPFDFYPEAKELVSIDDLSVFMNDESPDSETYSFKKMLAENSPPPFINPDQ